MIDLATASPCRLGNHILTAIDLPQPWERVVRLSLAPRLSEPPTLHLYAEVMGKHSNLVLVDAKDDAILVCGQQISSKQSRLRQLHIGDTYRLPPPALGAAPSLTEPQDRWTQNLQSAFELLAKERQRSPSLPEVLARAYQGVSPALARELAAAAGLPADVQASRAMYYEEPLDALFAEWQRWLRTLAAKSFAPGRTPEGAYSVLGGTLESDPDAPDLQERVGSDVTAGPSGRAAAPSPNALVPLPPLLAMIAAEYHSFEGERQFGTQRRDLEKAVTAAIRKVENRLRAFELQVVGAAAADEVQHQGDLLVASMWQIKPGMESLEVDDWTTGQKVTLQLDPKKKPQEQAEEFFKKARKLRRGADQVAALAEEAARQLEYLRGVELSLQQLGSAATTIDASGAGAEAGSEPEREDMLALLEIQEELIAGGFMKARPEASLTGKAMLKAKKGAGKAQKGPESGLRTFTSPGGFRVLVGRNNRQNDELSLKVTTVLFLRDTRVPSSVCRILGYCLLLSPFVIDLESKVFQAQKTQKISCQRAYLVKRTYSPFSPQICKDADWWFHAQGCPGAHVVLRVKDKSDDVPEPDLRFAASLAAYFSKARNADRFAVSMIKAGNVRKPRGAPPGMVTLTAPHKTILGFPPEVQALGGASEESG